jgi:hypothetical protein
MTLRNAITTAALIVAMLGFAGMMRIKTDVQTMDTERRKLVNERAELRETKRVLEAEWALLASPERLQVLADKAGKTYVNGSALSYIPFRPADGAVSPTRPSATSPTAQVSDQRDALVAGIEPAATPAGPAATSAPAPVVEPTKSIYGQQ